MGTSFTNPIARKTMPRHHEASSQRSLRDSDATPRVWQKSLTMAQQMVRLCQEVEQIQRELNRLRLRKGVASGGTAAPRAGMIFRGLWHNAVDNYTAQDVVFRTPSGGSAGVYIALGNVPTGTTPETGAPYWAAFPYPPPGVWG